MRESKSKNKSNLRDTNENSFKAMQMELELTALKTKNSDLTKAHTQIVQENADMRNQIFTLQADLVQMQSKYNSIHSSLANFQKGVKECIPNLISVLNLFLDIAGSNCTQSNSILNFSEKTYSPKKSGALTQTVKPHAVNGTVLNLNPTISLTRISSIADNPALNELSANTSADRSCVSSTTSNLLNSFEASPEGEGGQSESDMNILVKSRNKAPSVSTEFVNDEETEENSVPNSSEQENRNLSIIPEESFHSNSQIHRFSEVRIYLSPLSNEDIEMSLNRSCRSTTANANDSLNIDATVVENIDTRASKRLRADIMLFSPHTNSTRLECEGSFYEATASSQLKWLQTPSLSAMGDIDRQNGSRVDILRRDYSQTNISPITPLLNSTKYPSRHSQNDSKKGEGSPVSSRGSVTKRSLQKRNNISKEMCRSPTIVLERLENIMPSLCKNSIDQFSSEKIGEKHSKTTENKRKKLQPGSPTSGSKRKHKDDKHDENIRRLSEIKIEVSKFLPQSNSSSPSPGGRPKRAARPKSLKDASLKVKLRRMF